MTLELHTGTAAVITPRAAAVVLPSLAAGDARPGTTPGARAPLSSGRGRLRGPARLRRVSREPILARILLLSRRNGNLAPLPARRPPASPAESRRSQRPGWYESVITAERHTEGPGDGTSVGMGKETGRSNADSPGGGH